MMNRTKARIRSWATTTLARGRVQISSHGAGRWSVQVFDRDNNLVADANVPPAVIRGEDPLVPGEKRAD